MNNHAVYGHKYLFVLENVIAALPIITVLSVNTVSRVLICLLGQMELNGK